MSFDLANLIMDAMNVIGRNDLFSEGKSVDNHSTITISLGDMPDINLLVVDEVPMIWSVLGEYNENLLSQTSTSLLLNSINNQTESFYPGQPALVKVESELELRASFMPIALQNGESMAKAIDEYFQVMNSIHQQFIN
ncbi:MULTISPECIES: InvB/SpaK family type III secretion system chaperone [Enterobacterales]|uniref:InvB/SpaK family type III secretion system chaperone n=1 Tax=Enterobacterales TaxID=91347 RepID=UPI000847D7B4|nr:MULTISPECIES: type III secretion protein [Enterobacterales]WOO49388.1 type III secretion protein [Hafnia alvei]MCK9781273.1 type III secretion protein [Proteus columbae]MCT6516842.1 type III secretion protein [Proteus vulgaris]ODQ08111.1 type III secretion protein [Shigella sp. FC130]OEI93206.1 type III secretion protein [Shigella sp. FC1655]